MGRKIKFGIKLETYNKFGEPDSQSPIYNCNIIRELALKCEKLGYYAIFNIDHLIRGKGGYVLEGWTLTSALASITEKIKLGTSMLCNSFRYPQVLAKMASTLDVISEGRLDFGIGAGFLKEEYIAYGVPFPTASERILQLKEAVQIIRKLWTEKKSNFQGKYYQLKDAICEPKPIQQPHPPIMIGGQGNKMLRLVAELGDRSNMLGSPTFFKNKLETLKKYCEEINRDYSSIEKTWLGDLVIASGKTELNRKINRFKPNDVTQEEFLENNVVGTPDQCISKILEYAELGVTYYIFNFPRQKTDYELDLFAKDVIPSL